MNRRRIGLAAAIGLGVTALVGVPRVMAQEDPGPVPPSEAQAAGAEGPGVVTYSAEDAEASGTRTAANDTDLEFVALGTACRVVDTRRDLVAGSLSPGHNRVYGVTGTNPVYQGGTADDCGIPDSAVGASLSLSTLNNSPTADGFLRAGIAGATPTATVLQFERNEGTSVTTTVPLNEAQFFAVRGSGATIGLTVDVLGYYEVPAQATVDANGALRGGSGVDAVTKFGTGLYLVDFDRDVAKCTPVVSGYLSGEMAIANAALNDPIGSPTTVFVKTSNTNGSLKDARFGLAMKC